MSAIDHHDLRATHARLVARTETLRSCIDRIAEHPGLRDAASAADAAHRLSQVAAELRELTGIDHDRRLTDHGHPSFGELVLAASEVLAEARVAAWWVDEQADLVDHTSASPYL